MIIGLLAGIVAGAALGALVAWLLCAARSAERATHEKMAAQSELSGARAELSTLGAALERERTRSEERESAMEDMRRRLVGEFAVLSQSALDKNSSRFLELAEARLREAQQVAKGELDQRRHSIEELVSPLREQLGKYEEGLRLLELERQRAYTQLSEQVSRMNQSQEKLQSETRNLVTALRSPSTRGRWGEMQLRRVVEMAGMLEHCDFEEQVTSRTSDGTLRPDLIVRLPGAKQVVVDAKVPLQAFLDANDSTDDSERRGHLQVHARQLRTHIDGLSKKAYWRQFENSPEFVVAFIPGDPLLTAAFEHDPTLLEHAIANRVLLATPTTLIALLRAAAYGWQSEALAENAREVQLIGKELYKRLSTFGDHMARTGKSLRGAVDAYNQAVGSLEHNVMPQARRFRELGVVADREREAIDLERVDSVARSIQSDELNVSSRPLELVGPLSDGEDDEEPEDTPLSDAARG